SRAAARCSSRPRITELMNTFTMASVSSDRPRAALPPRVEPSLPRTAAIQMAFARAAERQVQLGTEPENQIQDTFLIRPLGKILQQQDPRLDRSRQAGHARPARLSPP